MNCETIDAALIEYVHGELDRAELARVSAHLAGCPQCAMACCRLQAELRGIALALADEGPGPEIHAALRARVAVAVRPGLAARVLASLRRPVPMYGAVLAAVAVALVWLVSARRPAIEPHAPSKPRAVTVDGYDASVPTPNPHHLL